LNRGKQVIDLFTSQLVDAPGKRPRFDKYHNVIVTQCGR
jgi:hypothetical protein